METNVNVLTSKVENFKLIARNALRMELISPRLSRIAEYESELNNIKERIANADHLIAVEDYEIIKLDNQHPNYKETKEMKEARIKELNEIKDSVSKSIVEIEKAIADQKASIQKIELGETKVCIEALNDLVEKMIKQNAYKQIA